MNANPLPWRIEGSAIRDANGEMVMFDHYARARTVACVNALAGVSDGDLAHLPEGHLARLMPITKDWRDAEFEAIESIGPKADA